LPATPVKLMLREKRFWKNLEFIPDEFNYPDLLRNLRSIKISKLNSGAKNSAP